MNAEALMAMIRTHPAQALDRSTTDNVSQLCCALDQMGNHRLLKEWNHLRADLNLDSGEHTIADFTETIVERPESGDSSSERRLIAAVKRAESSGDRVRVVLGQLGRALPDCGLALYLQTNRGIQCRGRVGREPVEYKAELALINSLRVRRAEPSLSQEHLLGIPLWSGEEADRVFDGAAVISGGVDALSEASRQRVTRLVATAGRLLAAEGTMRTTIG